MLINDIMLFVDQQINKGKKVALITLTHKSGNAPGAEGQMMAVLEDGTSIGTVGGGKPEHLIINQAQEAIKNNEKTFSFSHDLAQDGMICGGDMSGYGNVLGIGNKLVLFGGGHVAQALAKVAKPLGFHVIVIEDRKDLVAEFNDVVFINEEYSKIDSALIFDENAYVVIATRGHVHDREALLYSIDKEYAYLGMIGSKRKVKEIFNIVQKDHGITKAQLQKVYAPIGLELADGTPAEIAISILAEILIVKNNGKLSHKRDLVQLI